MKAAARSDGVPRRPARKSPLVDNAEAALRNWMSPGTHRAGDRLPPEKELAATLGVSRGTLRRALDRLEQDGTIVRRQGSGTFVGNVPLPAAFSEGLELLESYSSLARRRGVKLTVADLRIEPVKVDERVAAVYGVEPGTLATIVSRVVLLDGKRVAVMVDTLRPDAPPPPEARLRRAIERGDMVLDVLIRQGVPITFANTRITPRLVTAREQLARALGLSKSTAILELDETYYAASGEIAHHSRDSFAPTGLDLHVVRWLKGGDGPAQVRQGDGRRGGSA